ncbi:hypothetical protein [Aliifodinibius salipaludis]|uniref:hypothetical protein n=1 Tax=Fodinibius salipaludis TaxID=2032627 RepID=UPI0020D1CCEC|nr:hypothetical protein [Aliifodinibius salipaludis]
MLSSRVFVVIICATALFFCHSETKAQANPDSENNFGLGLILGEPTGLSIKSWNGDQSAFSIGAAWSLSEDEALHLHADFQLHSWFENIERGRLAFYYGIGGRVIFTDDAKIGVRVPLGLNYIFDTLPFDLFVEATPILDFTPNLELAGNGGVGIRYYFN